MCLKKRATFFFIPNAYNYSLWKTFTVTLTCEKRCTFMYFFAKFVHQNAYLFLSIRNCKLECVCVFFFCFFFFFFMVQVLWVAKVWYITSTEEIFVKRCEFDFQIDTPEQKHSHNFLVYGKHWIGKSQLTAKT